MVQRLFVFTPLYVHLSGCRRPLGHDVKQFIEVILLLHFILTYLPTELTAMENPLYSLLFLQSDWLHQATASFRPITRKDIDVLAPQTLGAMIGIAIPFGQVTTLFALKIFYVSLKHFARSHDASLFFNCIIAVFLHADP